MIFPVQGFGPANQTGITFPFLISISAGSLLLIFLLQLLKDALCSLARSLLHQALQQPSFLSDELKSKCNNCGSMNCKP